MRFERQRRGVGDLLKRWRKKMGKRSVRMDGHLILIDGGVTHDIAWAFFFLFLFFFGTRIHFVIVSRDRYKKN